MYLYSKRYAKIALFLSLIVKIATEKGEEREIILH